MERIRRNRRKGLIALGVALVALFWPCPMGTEPPPPPPPARPPKSSVVVIPLPKPPPKRTWHSRHVVKTWDTRYRGHIFRTTQLPRCEHVEMLITYRPAPGETCAQVRKRTGAIVVSSGSYHHPQTMALADFFERNGRVLMHRRTKRGILATQPEAVADILDEIVRGNQVSAIALGSRLVPFQLDGFPKSFANERTDRMGIGLTKGYIFVVQGNSDLWRLSRFFQDVLGCRKAINADGGHVVKGRGPVHIAFRWRKASRGFTPNRGRKVAPKASGGSRSDAAQPPAVRPTAAIRGLPAEPEMPAANRNREQTQPGERTGSLREPRRGPTSQPRVSELWGWQPQRTAHRRQGGLTDACARYQVAQPRSQWRALRLSDPFGVPALLPTLNPGSGDPGLCSVTPSGSRMPVGGPNPCRPPCCRDGWSFAGADGNPCGDAGMRA